MAIAQVYEWRPRPGALEQFLANAKRADKIFRRPGATTRTHSAIAGANPNVVIYVIETPNRKANGEFNAKLEAEADCARSWRRLIRPILPQTCFHRRSTPKIPLGRN